VPSWACVSPPHPPRKGHRQNKAETPGPRPLPPFPSSAVRVGAPGTGQGAQGAVLFFTCVRLTCSQTPSPPTPAAPHHPWEAPHLILGPSRAVEQNREASQIYASCPHASLGREHGILTRVEKEVRRGGKTRPCLRRRGSGGPQAWVRHPGCCRVLNPDPRPPP